MHSSLNRQESFWKPDCHVTGKAASRAAGRLILTTNDTRPRVTAPPDMQHATEAPHPTDMQAAEAVTNGSLRECGAVAPWHVGAMRAQTGMIAARRNGGRLGNRYAARTNGSAIDSLVLSTRKRACRKRAIGSSMWVHIAWPSAKVSGISTNRPPVAVEKVTQKPDPRHQQFGEVVEQKHGIADAAGRGHDPVSQ